MAFDRIIINEQDLTTAGSAVVNDNIVFIPGLMGRTIDSTNYNYAALPYGKKNVVVDKQTNVYTDIKYIVNEANKFPTNASVNDYLYNTLTKTLYQFTGDTNVPADTDEQVTLLNSSQYFVLDSNTSSEFYGLKIKFNQDNTAATIQYVDVNGQDKTTHYLKATSSGIEDTIEPSEATNFSATLNGNKITFSFQETSTTFYLGLTIEEDVVTLSVSSDPTEWTTNPYLYTQLKYTYDDTLYIVNYSDGWVLSEVNWQNIDLSTSNLYVNIAQENVPVLCSDLKTFYENFGQYPHEFEEDYTVIPVASDATTNVNGVGFNPDAIPAGGVIFKKGDLDTSFIEAVELINAGVSVLYCGIVCRDSDGEVTAEDLLSNIYAKIDELLNIETSDLLDKGTYNFKILTTGGYPYLEKMDNINQNTLTSYKQLLKFAKTRGDCYVLCDTLNNPARALTGDTSLYKSLEKSVSSAELAEDGQYGAIFYPYFSYECSTARNYNFNSKRSYILGSTMMPPSFAYLISFAKTIKNSDDWLAIAGVTRGQVPGLNYINLNKKLTATIADSYQEKDSFNINAITEVKPYGYCVWGNRTTFDNSVANGLTASSFLNLRSLVCDVKKVVWRAAQRCIFEQNTEVLWINFQSMITPTLDRMVSGQGIKNYKVVKVPTQEKAKLVAKIVLVPIYAIEQIEVTIVLTDDETQVD